MKALPSVIVGCILTWSAVILPAHAQNASGGGTLIMYSGHSTGMLSINNSAFTPYSGGDIPGVSTLNIFNATQNGLLHDVGSLQKSGTGVLNFTPPTYAGGSLIVSGGGTFTPAGSVTLNSGSTASFSGSLTISGNILDAGATLVTNATSTVSVGAAITLSKGSYFTGDGALTLTAGSVIVNGGTGTLGLNSTVNSGSITFGNGGTINSAGGTVSLGTGSTITASNLTVNAGTLNTGTLNVSNGNLIVSAGGTLNLTAGSNLTLASQITLMGTTPLNVNVSASSLLGKIPVIKDGVAGSAGTSFKFLDGVLTNASTISILYLPAAQNLVSDPLSLHISEFDSGVHDKYVLEMSYNPATVASLGDLSKLYLAWFDPSDSTWKNAVDGNSDGGASAQQIMGAYDPTTDFVLGDYGVDTANSMVWAVVDHNSTFGVAQTDSTPASSTNSGVLFTSFSVPEPSSAVLLLCGLPVFGRRSRRK